MFAIEELWKIEKLKPLQKAHDADPMDRRLVVVTDSTQPGGVNIAETEALHTWLEKQGYRRIPDQWESADLDHLQVVHVSQLSLEVMRHDPFSLSPSPLMPNSWLNRLPQDLFDALLLAQQCGDVPMVPNKLFIKDTLKPALEAESLSSFWSDMVALVRFAKSGDAPKNPTQKKTLADWAEVVKRRHYDPTQAPSLVSQVESQPLPSVVVRKYEWYGADVTLQWNGRLTNLREWIAVRVNGTDDLRNVATQLFGSSVVTFTGNTRNDAHALVAEATRRGKLNDLASHFAFIQEDAAVNSPSPFDQREQVVGGNQINITTGGGAVIGGNVVVGGDFVGRNVIITGDNNTVLPHG